MNQYIIALVISNIAWFGFVVMLLKSFHELRMKMERQFDTIRERHEGQLETASDNLRTANRMAEDLRKESSRLKSQLEAVERARDKYVTDVINNNSTIADLKKELETYETTYNDMNRIIGERDAEIAHLKDSVERLKEEGGRFAQLSQTRGNELIEQRNQAEKFRFEREQLKTELAAIKRTADKDACLLAEARKHNTSLRSAVTDVVITLNHAMEEN